MGSESGRIKISKDDHGKCSSKCIVEASSRVRESIVLTLLGGVMTGLSLLIMDSAPAEQTPKKLARCEFSPEKRGKIFKMSIFSDKDFAYIGEELDLLEVLRKD